MPDTYADKLQQEIANYQTVANVHDLPPIHHYCAGKYWEPKWRGLGFSNPDDLYLSYTLRLASQTGGPLRIISIGSGNGDLEVNLGRRLVAQQCTAWELHCLDVNPAMLQRAQALAGQAGLADHFRMIAADIQGWAPAPESYDVVIASHSLHHFVELELLFAKIHSCMKPHGFFLTNDMIGRNGHMRWPEPLAILETLWQTLDDKYKYNHHLRCVEHKFVNRDYSQSGFEGIRAQDILPLLVRNFSFEMFSGFGNIADIFIDRTFGHNYNPNVEKDRYIIDVAASLDDFFIENGFYKPTHIIAAMMRKGAAPPVRCYKHLTPEFCVYPV